MLKITTESGRQYLVDETEGAERFKRLPGRTNPFVPEHLNGKWLPLLEGSRYHSVGLRGYFRYGGRISEFILSTEITEIEELPDVEEE